MHKVIFLVAVLAYPSSLLIAQELEHIIVSANREKVQRSDVLSSVEHIEQEIIDLVSAVHIQQALLRSPGTWISRGNGQEHLSAIRSPVLTGAGACGAFYFAEDGIALRAPGFCNANQLFDANSEQAQAIEVLRGPQSTLYGTNAMHGVVNILSGDAFNHSVDYIALELGAHDYTRAKFSASSGDAEHALLAYGNIAKDGGYQEDSGFAQQKVNLIHQYQDHGWNIKNLVAASNLNQETAGFIQGQYSYQDPNLVRLNPNPEAYRDARSLRAYSELRIAGNNEDELMLKPYVRWNSMQFLQHYLPWQAQETNAHRSIGMQTQYSRRYQQFSLLSGFDWDYTLGELQETQAEEFSPSIPQGQHYDYQVKAMVYSPFAQVQWQASEDWQVTAGLRFERSEYDYQNKLSDGSACAPNVDSCRFTRPTDQVVDYGRWSGQFALAYAWPGEHKTYAKLSSGYRAPQATELFRLQAGQSVAELSTENLRALELGQRGQWGKLYYELSAYNMLKDGVIYQDTQRQNINGGETSHRGGELSLKYRFDSHFYASVAASYAKHRYQNSQTLSREDIKGNEIDTAPKQLGSLHFGWKNESYLAELEWVHVGKYYLNPENTAEYEGHNLINLRTSAQLTEALSVSGHILNLSDTSYAERADYAFGNYRYFVGQPRRLQISLTYQFM